MKKRRDKLAKVRVRAAQLALWQRAADSMNLTLSEFIRHSVDTFAGFALDRDERALVASR